MPAQSALLAPGEAIDLESGEIVAGPGHNQPPPDELEGLDPELVAWWLATDVDVDEDPAGAVVAIKRLTRLEGMVRRAVDEQTEASKAFIDGVKAAYGQLDAKGRKRTLLGELRRWAEANDGKLPNTAGMGAKAIWKDGDPTFEIVDESRVPREFMTVDEGKIRAAVKAGRTRIRGVEIYPGKRRVEVR